MGALPPNVGLMTLMRVAEEEGALDVEQDKGAWEAQLPYAFRAVGENQNHASTDDKVTLLVRASGTGTGQRKLHF